jgi:hypothetical protein
VAFIHREFFMGFDQFPLVIVNLLPKTQGVFVRIHFFQITRLPAQTPGDIDPVTPSSVGQFHPLAELLLIVLRSRRWLGILIGMSATQG